MPMTWATFESALDGARDASAALEALTTAFMTDLQETLASIGAAEAGPHLTQAQGADPQKRREQLATSLDIIDRHVVLEAPVAKRPWSTPKHVWLPGATHYGDISRSALLAMLIDAELGGDIEVQRRRFITALTAAEGHMAANRNTMTKSAYNIEGVEGRRACLGVSRLVLESWKSRKPR